MKTAALVLAGCLTLGACATPEQEGALYGGAVGATIGGLAGNSAGSAILGGAVGALAGAVLVNTHNSGRCTYRYKGKYYRERCRKRRR